MTKKTLIIGASEKPERYSNKAIRALRQHGHPVVALATRPGQVDDVVFETEAIDFGPIDTVSLYIGPEIQRGYVDYIISLHPKRVIFNPGTENDDFAQELEKSGIEPATACTLVLLSTGQY
ncbi:MAG: CoA-binding protein [Mangrovibacterium sp.]